MWYTHMVTFPPDRMRIMIVFSYRFIFYHFPLQNVAAAFLFLACKVEEQPRKLEHVVTVAYGCLHRGEPMIETSSEVQY